MTAPASPTSPTPSRRQSHKVRTERALQQAALELFSHHGFDATTTDDVAARAGVSPRTFFRYFATKDSVLFAGAHAWVRTLSDQLLAQPAQLSEVDALRESLLVLVPSVVPGRRSYVLFERAVASSPALRGRVHDQSQIDIGRLSEAIAQRRGAERPDPASRLLATIVLTTYRRALDLWLADTEGADLRAAISYEFDLLLAEFPSGERMAL